MDLINFAYGALTGVAGNAVYDGLKLVLGDTFTTLEAFAKNDEKEKFELVLQTAIESNETIKKQLEQLKSGQTITQINQHHTGAGDNVAGDKIVKG